MSESQLPRRLAADEIAKLAIDVVEGRVVMANSEEDLRWTFGPLIGMAGETLAPIVDEIGAFYEELDKALPRGVNGYPMFMSMQILHKEDLPFVLDKMAEYEKFRESFVGEQS